MIYDCFTFFNENDVLEIRFNVLKDIVDKFVIIEATKTFSGKDKPLYFDKERFDKFKDKIIYVVLDQFPEYKSAWIYENIQRNYILDVLKEQNCNDEDIILISDCDEIPNPKAIMEYKEKYYSIMSLEEEFFYYYLNLKNYKGSYWYGAKICRYKNFFDDSLNNNFTYNEFLIKELNKNISPNKIRMMENRPVIRNGGWHFSFLGGTDAIIKKVKSFSHQEYNSEEFLDKDKIEKKILSGKDIFNRRDFKLLPVKIDASYPTYIVKNQDKYKNLIFEIPKNKKLSIELETIWYKFRKFLYFKKKDGSKRIIKICGLEFFYDKAKSKKNKIGKNCKLKNVKLMGGNRIYPDCEIFSKFKNSIIVGKGTHIGKGCVISNWEKNSKITFGENVTLGFYNNLYGQGGIIIGNNVMTASNVCILTSNHGYQDINTPIRYQESSYAPVSIGDSTWLGYNVIILSGVSIGKHCTIGAGSVVTKDIPDYCVAVGNPCKVIKKYNFETQKWEKI